MLDPDLGDCTRYPLHRITAIQSHGYLLLVDRDLTCVACSANWPELSDPPGRDILGADLQQLQWARPLLALLQGLATATGAGRYLLGAATIHGQPHWCSGHRAGQHYVLEFEPQSSATPGQGGSEARQASGAWPSDIAGWR